VTELKFQTALLRYILKGLVVFAVQLRLCGNCFFVEHIEDDLRIHKFVDSEELVVLKGEGKYILIFPRETVSSLSVRSGLKLR
jgi:hypothetical protein